MSEHKWMLSIEGEYPDLEPYAYCGNREHDDNPRTCHLPKREIEAMLNEHDALKRGLERIIGMCTYDNGEPIPGHGIPAIVTCARRYLEGADFVTRSANPEVIKVESTWSDHTEEPTMSDELQELYNNGDMVWVDKDGREWVPAHALAALEREVVVEREQVCQFIRDMYTGRFAEREKYYWELPQWMRDAIEADPIYNDPPGEVSDE